MGNTLNTSHSSIFDYWKNKAITSDGTVIEDDFDDKNSIPVVYDWGEPCCWACGKFIKKSFEVKDYEELANKSPQKLYDSPKVRSEYNRCHIIPRQAGGGDDPSNLFLLCEECHEESPDTLNPKNFFKWVYKKRKKVSCTFGIDIKGFMKKYFEDCIEKGKDPFTCKPEKAKVYTHGARVSESTLVMALADTCDPVITGGNE